MESDTPIDLIASRVWSGSKWHYPHIEAMLSDIERLRAELAAAIKDRSAYRIEIDRLIQQRDEAHGLIRKWRLNLVDVVEAGEYMDAMTSEARIGMNDADKRAFLLATQKEGGGA